MVKKALRDPDVRSMEEGSPSGPASASVSAADAKRNGLIRLREKLRARSSEGRDALQPSQEDLTRLQYALAERQLQEQIRTDFNNRERLVETHLGVEWQGVALSHEKVTAPHINPVLRVVAQQLQQHREVEFAGGDLTSPPRWDRFEMGDEVELVPAWASIYWDAGTVTDVPLVLETWTRQGVQFVQVLSRPTDHGVAKGYLDDLIHDAKGPNSPYRGRLLLASWGNQGVKLEILSAPAEKRDHLVLPTSVWEALDLNVHRMFERMSAFRSAGLGSNRGVLLAGPPGTGKTAACKVLAGEVLGNVTAVFVDSKVAVGLLPQLYKEIAGLSPALLMIEDLDLVVGDRQERSARTPLFDFLTVLDGLMTQHHEVVTIATTNDPSGVDAGVRRAARFDSIITFPLPDEAAREEILNVYLRSVDHGVDTSRIAKATASKTGADLREYVRAALLGAVLSSTETLQTEHLMRVVEDDRSLPPDSATGPRVPHKVDYL